MSKISELGPITGANTRSEDLFVIVNLVQGDDGTKNITRKELVEALQYEIFSRIRITGESITTTFISNSDLDNVRIDNSTMEDSDISRSDFNNGTLRNSSGDNLIIVNSEFNDGNADNVVIINSQFNDGDLLNVDGDNVRLINSTIDDSAISDSTANNITISTSTFNNGGITNSTANNITITKSTFDDGALTNSTGDNLDITNSDFASGNIANTQITTSVFDQGALTNSTGNNLDISDSTVDNSTITNSAFNDGTADNVDIVNSDFSDGTGNNNVFTKTTIDQGTIQSSEIVDSSFAGTMDGVVATNMTITSSSASGFSQSKSTFDDGGITQSTFENGVIDQSKLVDFDMEVNKEFEPHIDENSWFALKNEKTGEVEKITYAQFFDEISRTTESSLKIHVDAAKGDDRNPGTMLQPIRSLERASELAKEKAGGTFDRNAINNAIHISCGPGTYYTKGNIALPDDCAMTSTAGQYATVIEALPGYEQNNAVLVGSGCYVQGFAYQNWKIDNFDFPEGGFAVAYRPGAKLLRSPYIRDSSQLSNFLREDVEPPLQPFNTKGNVLDLGREFILEVGHTGLFQQDDEVTFSSGAKGYISWDDTKDTEAGLAPDLATNRKIFVRNLKNNKGFAVGDLIQSESGGRGTIEEIGIDNFPNPLVGRGGGCMLADRRALDPDSLYTYVLCFGFTPRSQNGMGYVARDGAGVNGIGSLSIFVRVAFYALNGGQMTLNNSGTQFGDISMRAKGSTKIFAPKDTTANMIGNTAFADVISDNEDLIIEDMVEFLTANTSSGGLGYTGYDAQKCERDSKIIIDGLGYDMSLDTNYWGRLAGISYRSPISSKVLGEQLDATLGANRYLQARINDVFTGSNTEIFERANTSWNELYNVVEFGEENMNPIIFADTGDASRTSAREIIQDNRELIQNELLDWIDDNDQFYAYDSVKCRRDTTEYILPAVKYDALLDTNYNSVRAGGAYYMKSAEKVVGQQRNETIAAYKRLKEQTNELIDANSYIGTTRVDQGFDEIIAALDNRGTLYTPTNATYDPDSGMMVVTIGTHTLTVGRKILVGAGGITFSCGTDGNVTEISHPRPTDPAFNSPLEIVGVSSTTITVNAGTSFYKGVHTFVKAAENSIIELGSEITFSDDAAISADNRNARKQLQANRGFLQDMVLGYIDDNYFLYDSEKCERDITRHILPSVERDVITGSNFNARQTGIAYRQGTMGAETVVRDQLVETIGAIEHLKGLATAGVTDPASSHRVEESFKQIVDIVNNNGKSYTPAAGTTYDPDSGVMTMEIGTHDLQVGQTVIIADESVVFTCALDGNATNHAYPRKGDPAYRTPVTINLVTATTISVNVGGYLNGTTHTWVSSTSDCVKAGSYISAYTPSTATYDPSTGIFTATIGGHNLVKGDYVQFKPESIVFTCDLDGNNTEHATPEAHHPFYDRPVKITNVVGDVITMNVGAATNGGGAHTFVSAVEGAIEADPIVWTDPAKYLDYYTPTDSTYDPGTGVSTVTLPGHDIELGDYIEFAPYSFTFTCADDGNATEHSYPRKGDSNYREPMEVTNVAGDVITVNVGGTGGGGAHTFVSASDAAVAKTTYNSQGQLAREQLQANRNFLQEEVMAYLDTQYFVFDGDKCSRDSGFILDAVRRDVATGSNYNSVYAGLAYRAGTASGNYVIADQLTETVAAIQYLKTETATRLSGSEQTAANAAFDEIIDILSNGTGNADAYNFGTATAGTNAQNGRLHLQANKLFLQEEAIAFMTVNFPTFTYDQSKCRRDVGLLIDALSFDISHGSNTAGINFARLYFNEGVSTLPEAQKAKTAEVYEHLGKVASDIVQQIAVTATSGNGTTQDVSNPDAGIEIGKRSYDLMDLVAKVLREDTLDWLPTPIEPGYNTVAQMTASQAIDGITESLQGGVIKFLRENYNGLPYNKDKCRRDVGLITDAISKDIEYGGNASTIEAAKYYFAVDARMASSYEELRTRNVLSIPVTGQFSVLDDLAAVSGLREATNILPMEQRLPTKRAFEHLATIAGSVVQETPVVSNFTTYTPTNAQYIPSSGEFTAVIGTHPFAVGDTVYLKPNGFTFSCDMGQGSGVQNHTSPQKHHPFYNKPITITAITATNIVMNVGDGGSGLQPHTFVSADADSISTGPYQLFDGTATSAATGTAVTALYNVISDVVEDNDLDNLDTIEVKPLADPNRTVAREQIQINRDFIIDEVVAYLNDEYYTFDGEKCKRDLGLIIDAVKRDVLTGSDFNANFNGRAYRIGTVGADAVINDQLTETVSAIEYARDLCVAAVLDSDVKVTVAARFNRIIDMMGNGTAYSNILEFGFDAISSSRINARSQLQANKAFLQAEMTAWLAVNRSSHTYDVAKCERDMGYIIDSVSWDIQHGSNSASRNNATLYFENAISVLPEDQKEPTAAAFTHIASVARLVANGDPVTVTSGNAETQDTSSGNSGGPLALAVENLMLIIADAITENGLDGLPELEEPIVTAYDANLQAAYASIETAKTTAQAGVLTHLSTYFNTLYYNEEKCRRDTGYMIDAISHDIQYGGNVAITNATQVYFENAVNVLPLNQREPTRKAFLHLGKVMNHITREIEVTPTVGNTSVQNYKYVAANPMTGMLVEDLTKIVALAVEDATPTIANLPAKVEPSQTWVAGNYTNSVDVIENSSKAWADSVISHISTTYNGLSFPRGKCRRDVGYLVDAVSHDIQYGGNFATRTAAGIYFENGISVLPADTRTQTADIYNYLGTLAEGVVQETDVSTATTYTPTDATYDPATGVFTATIASHSFKVGDKVWFKANGITFSCNMGGGLQNHTSPQSHHPFYNRGCPITEVDGNIITMNVGTGGTGQVAHTFVSADADSLSTGPYQDTSGTAATATEGARAATLVGIIEGVIRDDDLDALPIIEEPDTSWVAADVIATAEMIDDNTEELAIDLVEFLRREFDVLDYNRDKCRRDTGYLLDAFSYDLNYGGNTASRWNADFYFWNQIYRIPEDQRIPTARSYQHLGKICKDIVLGKYPGQVVKSGTGTDVESKKVQDLANMFYLTQINNDTTYLPVKEEPDYSWIPAIVSDVSSILEFNKIDLAFDTVRYVNATYKYIDINLTRRDGLNLLKAIEQDFSTVNPAGPPTSNDYQNNGDRQRTRAYSAALFDFNGKHAFPVFNATTPGLKYINSVARINGDATDLDVIPVADRKPNHAYIVATNFATNFYAGDIYYWDGTQWVNDGANNTDLLDAFTGAWTKMRDYLITLSPDADHTGMINGLINDCLIDNVLRPEVLQFGSLVESIAHQFNGASAGVNRNALPLNFRNLGLPISALASVLSEDGGRVRWSGADELNNQYFARGLRINGRTGRIEGRPFTSSVRKLARRASNSRASI